MGKIRYVIKHIPSNRIIDSDSDGELYLIDEDDSYTTFGRQDDAEESLTFIKDHCCNEHGEVCTDQGTFEIDEFKVVEL